MKKMQVFHLKIFSMRFFALIGEKMSRVNCVLFKVIEFFRKIVKMTNFLNISGKLKVSFFVLSGLKEYH